MADTEPGASAVVEGLVSASFNFELEAKDVKVDDLLEHLASLPLFFVDRKGKHAGGAVMATASSAPFHAHFELSPSDNDGMSATYSIDSRRHDFEANPKNPDISSFVSTALAPYLNDPSGVLIGYINAIYELKTASWRPRFQLPFTPATGFVEGMPGVPQIAGVEFAFPNATKELPLMRAFISTYALMDYFTARLLIRFESVLDDHLPERIKASCSQQIVSLVRKASDAS